MRGTNGQREIIWSRARDGAASTWKRREKLWEFPRIRVSSMPTVSVIIPNYNHARFLRQRIESVLGQTYRDFEVILLNDGSSEGSPSPIFPVSVDSKNPEDFSS